MTVWPGFAESFRPGVGRGISSERSVGRSDAGGPCGGAAVRQRKHVGTGRSAGGAACFVPAGGRPVRSGDDCVSGQDTTRSGKRPSRGVGAELFRATMDSGGSGTDVCRRSEECPRAIWSAVEAGRGRLRYGEPAAMQGIVCGRIVCGGSSVHTGRSQDKVVLRSGQSGVRKEPRRSRAVRGCSGRQAVSCGRPYRLANGMWRCAFVNRTEG